MLCSLGENEYSNELHYSLVFLRHWQILTDAGYAQRCTKTVFAPITTIFGNKTVAVLR